MKFNGGLIQKIILLHERTNNCRDFSDRRTLKEAKNKISEQAVEEWLKKKNKT